MAACDQGQMFRAGNARLRRGTNRLPDAEKLRESFYVLLFAGTHSDL